MTLLSLLGLISALGAIAAVVALPCYLRPAEIPKVDPRDLFDGMAAWPDSSFQSGREI